MKRTSRRAYILFAIVMALYLFAAAVLIAEAFAEGKPDADLVFFVLTLLFFPLVGVLIASRRPDNAVGWILLAIGLAWAWAGATGSYAMLALRLKPGSLPGGPIAAALSSWGWAPPVGLMGTFLILLFPTGRLLSPRWRIVGWLSAFSIVGICIAIQFSPGELDDVGFPGLENPFYTPALQGLAEVLQLCVPLFAACFVASAVSLVLRFRRSRGVERIQMKWLTTAVAFVAGYFALGMILSILVGSLFDPTGTQPGWLTVMDQLGALTFFLIPLSIGIAILRHRLFDIDIVINKTLVYGALAGFITLVYVGVVVGVGTLVGAGDEPNLGLSLAATAIVAVAFQPVRQRIQRLANRLVYGQRLSPYEAVTEFSSRIATSLSFEEVLPRMAEAAAKGVGGTRAQVKMFLPGGSDASAFFPQGQQSNSFDRSVKVIHQGETVGEISVAKEKGEQLNSGEDKLLQDLASQAGLAMRNLRLTAELQQKLIELQESRKRIVEAQDAERRRMERDIHDGAQQQLVSLSVKLTLAKTLAQKDPQKAGEMLDQIKAETEAVIESVRDLARGIFPPLLAERGLGEALRSHAQKTAAQVTIEDATAGLRFSPDVESAIYFTIREALQNASKHAPGLPITVELSTSKDNLRFKVTDQGPGFDMGRVQVGMGLKNMRDRIEAIGGEFRIKSSPGRGATIEGAIPLKVLEPVS